MMRNIKLETVFKSREKDGNKARRGYKEHDREKKLIILSSNIYIRKENTHKKANPTFQEYIACEI